MRCYRLRRLLAAPFTAPRDADLREPPAAERAEPFRADDAGEAFRTEPAGFEADRFAGARFTGLADFVPFAAGDFAAGSALFFAGSGFAISLRTGAGFTSSAFARAAGSGARAVFAAAAGTAGAAPLAGAGGFFGRPLRRAAFPAASIASNAAFASAMSWACGEVRSRCTRSFSAW